MAASEKFFTMKGDLSIIINAIPITGLGDSDLVDLEFDEEIWFDKVGGDGEFTRMQNKNSAGKAKLTLMGSSESNLSLAAGMINDIAFGNSVFPAIIKDDTWQFTTPGIYVKEYPKMDRKKNEVPTRVWMLRWAHGVVTPLSSQRNY